MQAEAVLKSEHWKVWRVDDPGHDLHLMLTLLASEEGRAPSRKLLDDEMADLVAVVRSQVDQRELPAYQAIAYVSPTKGVEVHLIADGPAAAADTCQGIPATVDAGDVRFVLDLAQAVVCPLCGHAVSSWHIENGRMKHDPGE